jgi:HPt (histidine-containing phosphotransfer) domain-containing protein
MATIIPAYKRLPVTPARYTFLDLRNAQDIAGAGEALRELVQTFEVSLTEEMEKINQGLARLDVDAVQHSLHTLKGFISMFVVPTLAYQVELLYKHSRIQPVAQTGDEFNALVPKFQTLLSEVSGWLRL